MADIETRRDEDDDDESDMEDDDDDDEGMKTMTTTTSMMMTTSTNNNNNNIISLFSRKRGLLTSTIIRGEDSTDCPGQGIPSSCALVLITSSI